MNVCILKIIERSVFHENLTFSMFKCYNRVPVHLPIQKTLKRTTHLFQTFIFSKPFSAGLWKNEPLRFLSHCDVERGSYNITAPWSVCFHPRRKRQWCTSSNAMGEVQAKHANCSVFGCTDENTTLFRVSASGDKRGVDLLIYLLYITLLPQI